MITNAPKQAGALNLILVVNEIIELGLMQLKIIAVLSFTIRHQYQFVAGSLRRSGEASAG
jgi:hypothetical protein